MPENALALSVWTDATLFGWDAALSLQHRELAASELGDLRMKLRVLASEWAELQAKRKQRQS